MKLNEKKFRQRRRVFSKEDDEKTKNIENKNEA